MVTACPLPAVFFNQIVVFYITTFSNRKPPHRKDKFFTIPIQKTICTSTNKLKMIVGANEIST